MANSKVSKKQMMVRIGAIVIAVILAVSIILMAVIK